MAKDIELMQLLEHGDIGRGDALDRLRLSLRQCQARETLQRRMSNHTAALAVNELRWPVNPLEATHDLAMGVTKIQNLHSSVAESGSPQSVNSRYIRAHRSIPPGSSVTVFSYTIKSEIFEAHPEYCRGVVVFRNLDNSQRQPEVTQQLRDSEAALRDRIVGNPAEYPQIVAWRDAYRQFGAKPSAHRSSIEALSRRVLKPDSLPDINTLVDIGNLLSLRYVLPAGVHPITAHSLSVELRKANSCDAFLAEADKDPEAIPPGEIVLAAGSRVLTRCWSWRQAADTRTLPDTSFVFFDIDGLPPTSGQDVEAAIADLTRLVSQFCLGECLGYAILNADNPYLGIELE